MMRFHPGSRRLIHPKVPEPIPEPPPKSLPYVGDTPHIGEEMFYDPRSALRGVLAVSSITTDHFAGWVTAVYPMHHRVVVSTFGWKNDR